MRQQQSRCLLDHLHSEGGSTRLELLETLVCHMVVVSDPDGNSMIHQRKAG